MCGVWCGVKKRTKKEAQHSITSSYDDQGECNQPDAQKLELGLREGFRVRVRLKRKGFKVRVRVP